MRLILGMILGAVLTIVGAYIHDSGTSPIAPPADTAQTDATHVRPMVNWDVVGQEWDRLNARAQAEWNKWTAK
ncbi:MAG: hypothetical protein AB7O60_16745 [Variibacter sp.]